MLTNGTITKLRKCWQMGQLTSLANVDKQDNYQIGQMLTNRTVTELWKCWQTGQLLICANVDKQDNYRVVQMLTNRTKMLKTPNSRAIVYLRPIFSSRKAVKNNPAKQKKNRILSDCAWDCSSSSSSSSLVFYAQSTCIDISGWMWWDRYNGVSLCNANCPLQCNGPFSVRQAMAAQEIAVEAGDGIDLGSLLASKVMRLKARLECRPCVCKWPSNQKGLWKGVNHRHTTVRVQELCESRGGRPGLSVLTSLLVSVDVKQHRTVLQHWSQFVPNTSTDFYFIVSTPLLPVMQYSVLTAFFFFFRFQG